jgi:cytochrome c553
MMPRLARFAAALAGACACTLALGTATPPDTSALSGELKTALEATGDTTRGKAAFDDCTGCHRKDGGGRAAATVPRLAGQHAAVIVKQLVDIRSGKRQNPRMKPLVDEPGITAQVLADIAAYVQALPVPGNNTQGPGNDLALGKRLFDKDCAACHGASGEGQAQRFYPMVSAQHFVYLRRELELIRSGERGNSNADMARLLQAYSATDLQALADHMSRLPATAR